MQYLDHVCAVLPQADARGRCGLMPKRYAGTEKLGRTRRFHSLPRIPKPHLVRFLRLLRRAAGSAQTRVVALAPSGTEFGASTPRSSARHKQVRQGARPAEKGNGPKRVQLRGVTSACNRAGSISSAARVAWRLHAALINASATSAVFQLPRPERSPTAPGLRRGRRSRVTTIQMTNDVVAFPRTESTSPCFGVTHASVQFSFGILST
jgi:hypothetical protein